MARKCEFLCLRNSANGEVALELERVWAGLDNLCGFEGDRGRFLHVEEVKSRAK